MSRTREPNDDSPPLTADEPPGCIAVACMHVAAAIGAQRSGIALSAAYERLEEYCRLCASQERALERQAGTN